MKKFLLLLVSISVIAGCGDGRDKDERVTPTREYTITYSNDYIGAILVADLAIGPNTYPLDTTSTGQHVIPTVRYTNQTFQFAIFTTEGMPLLEIDRFYSFGMAVDNCQLTADNIVKRIPGAELTFASEAQTLTSSYVIEVNTDLNGDPICFGPFPSEQTMPVDCPLNVVLTSDLDTPVFWVLDAAFVAEQELPVSFPFVESTIYPGSREITTTGLERNQDVLIDIQRQNGVDNFLSGSTNWDDVQLLTVNATSIGTDSLVPVVSDDPGSTATNRIQVHVDDSCNVTVPSAITDPAADSGAVYNQVNWVTFTLCGGSGFVLPPESYFDIDPTWQQLSQNSDGCWDITYSDVPTEVPYSVILNDLCYTPVTDTTLCQEQWLTPIGSSAPNSLSALIPPYIVEVTTSTCPTPLQPIRQIGGGLLIELGPDGCLDVPQCQIRYVFDQNDTSLVFDTVDLSIGVTSFSSPPIRLFDQGSGSWARERPITPGRYQAAISAHGPETSFVLLPLEDYGTLTLEDPLGIYSPVLVDSTTVYQAAQGDAFGTGYTPVKANWNLEVMYDSRAEECVFAGTGLGEGSDGNIFIIITP